MKNYVTYKVAQALKKGWTQMFIEGKKMMRTGKCPDCGKKRPLMQKDVRVMLICSKCEKVYVEDRKGVEPNGPTNPIHAAVMGIRAGVKDLKSQCTGTTARGQRCKRKVTPPSTTCPFHAGDNLGF